MTNAGAAHLASRRRDGEFIPIVINPYWPSRGDCALKRPAMRIALAILVLTMGVLVVFASADSSQAQTEATAVTQLRVRAERGDADAQYELGLRCVSDNDLPAIWFQKAAEQGHPNAQTRLDTSTSVAEACCRTTQQPQRGGAEQPSKGSQKLRTTWELPSPLVKVYRGILSRPTSG